MITGRYATEPVQSPYFSCASSDCPVVLYLTRTGGPCPSCGREGEQE